MAVAAPMPTGGAIYHQIPLAGGRLLTGHGFDRMGIGLWQEGRGTEWEEVWFFDFSGSFLHLATGFHADRFFLLHGKGPSDRDKPTLTARSFADLAVIAEVPFPYESGASLMAVSPDGAFVVGVCGATLVVWRPGEKPEKARPCGRKHL